MLWRMSTPLISYGSFSRRINKFSKALEVIYALSNYVTYGARKPLNFVLVSPIDRTHRVVGLTVAVIARA